MRVALKSHLSGHPRSSKAVYSVLSLNTIGNWNVTLTGLPSVIPGSHSGDSLTTLMASLSRLSLTPLMTDGFTSFPLY